jgi:hypothetical protein
VQRHAACFLQSPDSIRYEVVRMMRMIVSLTNTLDEVEAPYYITMKLEYHESAPEHFELPAFTPLEVVNMTHLFDKAPFSMCALHSVHRSTILYQAAGSSDGPVFCAEMLAKWTQATTRCEVHRSSLHLIFHCICSYKAMYKAMHSIQM